ncbi:TPA: hypothetical protein ACH3X2_001766 [Trebouxia sp. C0005]
MSVVQVIMTRLGYTQASVTTVLEPVMQKATQACLLACACLHSAEPKAICHCDVRFADVLWDPEPFLADLEFAHFSPWQVKQNFSLKDWDEGTLDDMGCYTPQSDTYQFGVMLLKSRHLSADGFRFAQKLKAKTITAVDAAEDPYLKTPNLMCEGGNRLFNQKLSHASMIESVWHNCASWQPQSRKLTRTGDEVPAVGKIVSLWSPGKPPPLRPRCHMYVPAKTG